MKPKIFFVIAALMAAATLGPGLAKAAAPPDVLSVRLSKTVSAVVDPTGLEVHVWCTYNYSPESAGGGDSTGRLAWVSAVRCAQVEALANGLRPRGAKAKAEFATALGRLLTAANMAVGLRYEDLAACKAAQQVERLAETLGVNPRYARELAAMNAVLELKPEGCRRGGPMDFGLGRWPDLGYGPPYAGGKGGIDGGKG